MTSPNPPYRRVVFYPDLATFKRFQRATKKRGHTMTLVLRALLKTYVDTCDAKDAAQEVDHGRR